MANKVHIYQIQWDIIDPKYYDLYYILKSHYLSLTALLFEYPSLSWLFLFMGDGDYQITPSFRRGVKS